MRSRLWPAAGISVALAILLQLGELCCGVFAGQWTSEDGACSASGPAKAGKPFFFDDELKFGWSYETSASRLWIKSSSHPQIWR